MLLCGRMSFADFVGYVVAQFAGGIAGAAVLRALIGTSLGLGANGIYKNAGMTMIVEIILTFVFVFVILGVSSKPDYARPAGLVIGLTLTLVHIFGIYFTGTSVNPARSFGPALLLGGEALANVWPFLIAPLVGGALAAATFRLLVKQPPAGN